MRLRAFTVSQVPLNAHLSLSATRKNKKLVTFGLSWLSAIELFRNQRLGRYRSALAVSTLYTQFSGVTSAIWANLVSEGFDEA